MGLETVSLVDSYIPSGNYEIIFNASGLPSGVYFCKLNQENYSETKKMLLLR
ncbi:MAG: T9SS type A sorting domain-containing protein [Ignavibacteria bacterium]